MLRKPVGGYKMIYEYANRLSDKGYDISIAYINDTALRRFHMPGTVRKMALDIFTKIEPGWFHINKRVKKLSILNGTIHKCHDKYDVVIATGVDTVKTTMELFKDTHKAYFIQDYETWVYPEAVIQESFNSGMDNIVISGWLKKLVDKYGSKPALLIQNPIDTKIYRVLRPIEKRERYTIGVLYHRGIHKGFEYSYAAINKLKDKYPQMKVKMFGTAQPDFELPDWIGYTLNATYKETVDIYNSVSVFICSTLREGYGLTGLEAMACGAVLISTDYDGVREYAVNEHNALLSKPEDVESMVKNVERVWNNEEMLSTLSQNGVKRAEAMGWEPAVEQFQSYLDSIIT